MLAAEAHPVANDFLPALTFGGVLAVLGVVMVVGHVRSWRKQRSDHRLGMTDLDHYAARFRRRMQTSIGVIVIGVLIAAGDIFIWRFGPMASTAFWMTILVFACWIAMLAIGDMTAIKVHSQSTLAHYEASRRALEAELAELRKEAGMDSPEEPTNREA